MISTRHLLYFVTAAREENITRAAEILCVTQSALSRQIMNLENELGVTLFERGRKLKLTESGKFLYHRAREILELIERTERDISTEGFISGDIYIGGGEMQAMDLIAETFETLRKSHPDVILHIFSGDAEMVLERLDLGTIDMGILLGSVDKENYDWLKLPRRDTFGLLMKKDAPLSHLETIPIENLKDLPLIISEQTIHDHGFEWLDHHLEELNIIATYHLIYNAVFLVERGLGYALTISGLVNTDDTDLVFVPIEPELALDVYLVTKKFQTFSPAADAFIKALKAAIKSPRHE